MSVLKFDYLKLDARPTPAFPRQRSISRPLIPVKLLNEGELVKTIALIDSGADWCIFHGDLGELIGLDVRSGMEQDFYGIIGSGPGQIFFHDISVEIGGIAYPMRCGFSYDISPNGYGVLGQFGFFDTFDVNFKRRKQRIELKEV